MFVCSSIICEMRARLLLVNCNFVMVYIHGLFCRYLGLFTRPCKFGYMCCIFMSFWGSCLNDMVSLAPILVCMMGLSWCVYYIVYFVVLALGASMLMVVVFLWLQGMCVWVMALVNGFLTLVPYEIFIFSRRWSGYSSPVSTRRLIFFIGCI